jgi:hypothetical protein
MNYSFYVFFIRNVRGKDKAKNPNGQILFRDFGHFMVGPDKNQGAIRPDSGGDLGYFSISSWSGSCNRL